MDPTEALAILTDLRARARLLREQPAPGGELFQLWHDATLRALDQIYGPSSPEKREFLAISFEISPTYIDRVERVVTDMIQDRGGPVPADLPLGQDIYYDHRLIDADTFFLARIDAIRNKS